MLMDDMDALSMQRMQLSDDPDDWVWVRWYWCQKGAKPYAKLNAYTFGLWESAREDELVGPRIHMRGGVYARSRVSPFPGQHFLGKEEWFANGLPASVRGGPVPDSHCGVKAIYSGLAVGLAVKESADVHEIIGEGGAVGGGEGLITMPCRIYLGGCIEGKGGGVGGGEAALVHGDTIVGVGGAVGGGEGSFEHIEPPPPSSPLNDSLAAYWKFDDSAWPDSIGSLAFSDVGSPAVGTGLISGAVELSGAGEYLTRADDPVVRGGDGSWSVAGWYYVNDAADGYQTLITKEDGTLQDYNLGVGITSSSITPQASSTGFGGGFGGGVTWGSALSVDAWHFIAFGHDADAEVYWMSVDGAEKQTSSTSGSTLDTSTGALKVGHMSTLFDDWLVGRVDELGFWGRALSQGELNALYNGGAGLTYPYSVAVAYDGDTIDTFDQLTLSGAGPWPGVAAGQTIDGPGVPPGTTVLSVGGIGGNVITMSAAATATTRGTYTFSP